MQHNKNQCPFPLMRTIFDLGNQEKLEHPQFCITVGKLLNLKWKI